MAIAKGEQWGSPGMLSADAPVAASDAEAAALVEAALVQGAARTVGLRAGDLARTLGIREPYDPRTPKHLVPIDAVRVELDDGTTHLGLAHIVAGDIRRDRQSAAIMNAAFIGTRNIAPRAHPGDGKAEVVRLDLGLGDRLKAWQRMLTGTHVPHPSIKIRQRTDGIVELDRARRIRVDGRPVGHSIGMRFQVIPAAIVVAVS